MRARMSDISAVMPIPLIFGHSRCEAKSPGRGGKLTQENPGGNEGRTNFSETYGEIQGKRMAGGMGAGRAILPANRLDGFFVMCL
jgi:hypothetical protein